MKLLMVLVLALSTSACVIHSQPPKNAGISTSPGGPLPAPPPGL